MSPRLLPMAGAPAAAAFRLIDLPEETKVCVLEHLTGPELARMQRVSRKFGDLAQDQLLWRHAVRTQQRMSPQRPPKGDWRALYANNALVQRAWRRGDWHSGPAISHGPAFSHQLMRMGPLTVICDYDGIVTWPAHLSGTEAQAAKRRFGPSFCSASAPLDDEHLAIVTRTTIEVWNMQGERLSTRPSRGTESRAVQALTPERFAVAYHDGDIDIWDTANLTQPIRTLSGHLNWVNTLARLPDGRIVSGSSDHTARIWDPETGECTHVLEGHAEYIKTVLTLSDGRLVTSSIDRTIRVWDTHTGAQLQNINGGPFMSYAVCELPGGLLAAGNIQGDVRIFDLQTGETLRTEPRQTARSENIRAMLKLEPTRLLAIVDRGGATCFDVA